MTAWYASPYTGLFRQIGVLAPRPHDPPLSLCSGSAGSWRDDQADVAASGIGWEDSHAEAACVGEAIERLQAYPLPDDHLVEASYTRWPLTEPAVPPGAWVLFHAEQYRQPGFPFEPLMPRSVCRWVCCRRADDGSPCWAPAELVYLHLRDGHCICPGVSTGLVSGRAGDPLVLRGLQEVIERDGVLGAWWGRYVLEEYDAAAIFARLGPQYRDALERPNLTYRCYRALSPFSAHVMIVRLEGQDREGYCFSVGSACRETAAASWDKAIREAIHGRHYVRHLLQQVARGQLQSGPWPESFAAHALYYSLHPQQRARNVFASPSRHGTEPFPPGREDTSLLSARLGPERPVLFRSMTPPALAAEGLDWHVIRVVVPGLQPLHGSHLFPHLGGPLWAPRGLAEWSHTPPHPFP